MSAQSDNPILDPTVRFITMGLGIACVGSVIPKFIITIFTMLKLPIGFFTANFITLAIVLLVIGFFIGGIIGLKLDPAK